MYQIGDCVVKPHTGLCRIEDILHLHGSHVDEKRLYYLLIPVADEKMKIYVPVDRVSGPLRKALDCEEAWSMIKSISQIDAVCMEEENEKKREQIYKEAIGSCKPERWVSIMKTMYMRKQKRSAQGKKNSATDEHYFRLAEEYLHSELAHAIGKEKNEMSQLIADTVKQEPHQVYGAADA